MCPIIVYFPESSTVTEIRQDNTVHDLSPRRSSAALNNLPKRTLSSYSEQPSTDPEYMPKHGRGQLVKRQSPVSVSYSGLLTMSVFNTIMYKIRINMET